MRLLPGLVGVSLLTLTAAACSHGAISELPVAPTRVPVIARLIITPVGGATIPVGGAAPIVSSGPATQSGSNLGAFAQYNDGSGHYVAAQWTTSDANVIAIEDGTFMAVGRGTATITATAESKTASETFTVRGGIAGTWSGTYTVEQCAAGSGSMQEVICLQPTPGRTPGVLYAGSKPPLTMQITQSGKDLTATVQFGALVGTLAGRDRGGNFMTFSGNVTVGGTTASFITWDGRVIEDVMEGVVQFEVRVAGLPSHAVVVARLDNITRR